MKNELDLPDFIKTEIATPDQWEKYEAWGSDSLFARGYWTEPKDPALRNYINSGPDPEWHEREAIYKDWGKKISDVLRNGEWEAFSKVGSSTVFTPIEISVASQLDIKLHENNFTADGRSYAIVVFRKSSSVSNTVILKKFIETVCGKLSPENIVKDDVRELAGAELEFSFSKGHFHNVWLSAEIHPDYRKAGARAGKKPSPNRGS